MNTGTVCGCIFPIIIDHVCINIVFVPVCNLFFAFTLYLSVAGTHICLGMVPVVDGPGGYIPDTPQNLRESGEFKYIPEMIGYNQNDAFEYTLLR